MFDTMRCSYPLPHDRYAEYQTKDLAHLVHDEHGLGGTMEEYEVTREGGLRRHVHDWEWRESESAFGGNLVSVRDWWEDVPDILGDVRIYTSISAKEEADPRWVEFRLRFTNGSIQDVRDMSTS